MIPILIQKWIQISRLIRICDKKMCWMCTVAGVNHHFHQVCLKLADHNMRNASYCHKVPYLALLSYVKK